MKLINNVPEKLFHRWALRPGETTVTLYFEY